MPSLRMIEYHLEAALKAQRAGSNYAGFALYCRALALGQPDKEALGRVWKEFLWRAQDLLSMAGEIEDATLKDLAGALERYQIEQACMALLYRAWAEQLGCTNTIMFDDLCRASRQLDK